MSKRRLVIDEKTAKVLASVYGDKSIFVIFDDLLRIETANSFSHYKEMKGVLGHDMYHLAADWSDSYNQN